MSRYFGIFILCLSIACGAQAGGGAPPIVRPPVEAGIEAPLIKVAELRMREARFAAAAVAQGEHLYIIGGSNAGNWVLDSIERLDLRTGKSEPFARLQRGRLWHRAVIVGHTIHVLGGESTFVNAQGQTRLITEGSVELIDLPTRRVSRGPAMPEARRSFGCVLFDGKIHVIGGCLRSVEKEIRRHTTMVFDLTTQRWSPGAAMPTSRESEAVLVDGPAIVVPGGYNGVMALADVEFFNLRDGTWRTLPPLCRPASAHAVAFLGQHLFLFGHYDAPGQCLAYDLRTRRSEAIAVPFTGARHTAAVVHQGRIHIIGGRGDESPEAFDLIQVFALRQPGRGQTTRSKG